jgi:hypothetical protein
MNKKAIIIGSLAVIGVGAYFVLKPKKPVTGNTPDTVSESPSNSEVSSATQPSAQLDKSKVLSLGSKGQEVRELQKKLGGLVEDGDFGVKTEGVLKLQYGVTKVSLEQLEKMIPKKQYVKTIFNRIGYNGSEIGLYSMDLDFLKKWSSAIKENKPYFEFASSKGLMTFNTSSGKAEQQTAILGGLITYN